SPNLVDVLREIDAQIGRIVDAADPDTAVVTFSLHGMKPGVGIPMLAAPVLERLGFSTPRTMRSLGWRDRAVKLYEGAKRHAPSGLRSLYQRTTSYATRKRLARPTIIPPHDWSRTRAFSLPTDQRGYLRVNLAGREAQGIVPERDYEATCDEIEDAMMALRTPEGERLASGVQRPAQASGSPPSGLPDVIVDWTDAAFPSPVRAVAGSLDVGAH